MQKERKQTKILCKPKFIEKKGQYKERKQERNEKGDECEKDKETHECEHLIMKDKHKNVRI